MGGRKPKDFPHRGSPTVERRFLQLQGEIEQGDLKRVKKQLDALEGKGDYPVVWLDMLKALYYLYGHDVSRSVQYAHQVEQAEPTEQLLVDTLAKVFRLTGQITELLGLYMRLDALGVLQNDAIESIISLHAILGNWEDAQRGAMRLAKLAPGKSRDRITALIGGLSYLAAEGSERRDYFLKFAASLLERSEAAREHAAALEIGVAVLVNMGEVNRAAAMLDRVNPGTLDCPVLLPRLRCAVLASGDRRDEICDIVLGVWRNAESDVLNELKVMVRVCDPVRVLEVLRELQELRPAARSPWIARLDLAVRQGEDLVPLLVDYTERFKGSFLLGDLRPYLDDEVCARMAGRSFPDVVLDCYVRGAFDEARWNPTEDPRCCLMKAEELIRDGLFSEALMLAQLFPDDPEVAFCSMRIAGMMGLTAMQESRWRAMRLAAPVQGLSLISSWFSDAVRAWDFEFFDVCAGLALGCLDRDAWRVLDAAERALGALQFGHLRDICELYADFRDGPSRRAIMIVRTCRLAFEASATDDMDELRLLRRELPEVAAGFPGNEEVVPVGFRGETLRDRLIPTRHAGEFVRSLAAALAAVVDFVTEGAELPGISGEFDVVNKFFAGEVVETTNPLALGLMCMIARRVPALRLAASEILRVGADRVMATFSAAPGPAQQHSPEQQRRLGAVYSLLARVLPETEGEGLASLPDGEGGEEGG